MSKLQGQRRRHVEPPARVGLHHREQGEHDRLAPQHPRRGARGRRHGGAELHDHPRREQPEPVHRATPHRDDDRPALPDDARRPGVRSTSTTHGVPDAERDRAASSSSFISPIASSRRGKPGPIIENAHGLLGDETEGEDSYLAQICDREGYVGVAVDLIGMASDDDRLRGERDRHRPEPFRAGDRATAPGARQRAPRDAHDDGRMSRPTRRPSSTASRRSTRPSAFYRGDSQGGILGATFMTICTDVTRGLLGEPGAPYSLLLNRSGRLHAVPPLDASGLPAPARRRARHRPPRPLVGPHRAGRLPPVHATEHARRTPHRTRSSSAAALGDHQVTPLGAEFMARTMGAQNLLAVNAGGLRLAPTRSAASAAPASSCGTSACRPPPSPTSR